MEREGRKGGEEGGSAGGEREKVKEREWGGRNQAQNVSKIKLRELFSAHVTSDLCKELLLLLPALLPPGLLDVVGCQSVQDSHLVLLTVCIAHVCI